MNTPDTRLVALHAENGSPHARLSSALAALEGADWGLMLHGEAGLARQLAALLGTGTLRVDPRLKLSRETFAAYGLALATIDADWRGAKAVWLLEPTERDLKRATRSEVPLIADSTLAPGSGWLSQGAQLLVYRDGATLSGFGDLEISAIFGKNKAPIRSAPAPSDLSLAMVLRDLATLPLRLARAARTTTQLAEQFGGAAQPVGPTALLLAPDSAPDTLAPLGGVLAAAVAVPAGTLITPGVQSASQLLGLLRADVTALLSALPEGHQAETNHTEPKPAESRQREHQRNEHQRPNPQRHDAGRAAAPHKEAPHGEGQQSEGPRHENPAAETQRLQESREFRPNQPPQSQPQEGRQANQQRPAPARPTVQAPPAPTDYTPEIVFSDSLSQHSPAEGSAQLTQITPVSSGPDEPDVLPVPNVAQAFTENAAAANHTVTTDRLPDQATPQAASVQPVSAQATSNQPTQAQASPQQPAPPETEPEINLPPDLPPTEASAEAISGLSDEQQVHFARLRDWRNAEAKRLEVSRFIVASNATLAELARAMPQTENELRQVRGMGVERMRKYGAAILQILKR